MSAVAVIAFGLLLVFAASVWLERRIRRLERKAPDLDGELSLRIHALEQSERRRAQVSAETRN